MDDRGMAATERPSYGRSLLPLLVISFGTLASFYLLVPVVPLYAAAGGAGNPGTGLSNGTMLLATVLTEFMLPGLLRRYGYRAAMALGAALLGIPSAAMTASAALPLVLTACLIRGAGLGIVVVAGPALVAELVPDARRGSALGVYGVAAGVPAIVGLPLGLWLSLRFGYAPVFAIGAGLALLTLVAVPGLPPASRRGTPPRRPGLPLRRRHLDRGERQAAGILRGLRDPRLARPTAVFAAITVSAGIVLTFLPLAVPAGARPTAATALLSYACAMPLARWFAGRYGDRRDSSALLVPAIVTAAAGMALAGWLHNPYAVIVGGGLFGLGFGAAQNVTLEMMFARSEKSEFGRISALWNLAYDGGMGLGAAGFGLVAGQVGYAWGFVLTAAVVLSALVPAWRDRDRGRR